MSVSRLIDASREELLAESHESVGVWLYGIRCGLEEHRSGLPHVTDRRPLDRAILSSFFGERIEQ